MFRLLLYSVVSGRGSWDVGLGGPYLVGLWGHAGMLTARPGFPGFPPPTVRGLSILVISRNYLSIKTNPKAANVQRQLSWKENC